jgi:hypothetical protein
MITPIVERYIDTNNRPLTPTVCDPKKEKLFGLATQVAEEWPKLIQGFSWSQRNVPLIVGLYVGGHREACGIFHPVGRCMMRNNLIGERKQAFCPVCRYALVDFIDPSQHGSIDAAYEDIYES